MRRHVGQLAAVAFLALLLMALPTLAACGGDGEEEVTPTPAGEASPAPTPTPTPTAAPATEPTPTPEPTPEPTQTVDLQFYRNPDYHEGYQNPLPHLSVPQHPFLAPSGKSNLHNDAYMTDTYEVSGPLGLNPTVEFMSYGDFVNMPVTITFDSKGRIVTTIAQPDGYRTSLLDRDTLEELASYPHPPRHSGWPKDPLYPYRDTSGGAYFILDNQDRVLFATFDNSIQVIQYVEDKSEFELVREYDLGDHVVPMDPPARDHVQMAIPDWEGWLWFTTRYGKVGTIDPDSGEIHSIELIGEEMQNSFTVGEDGVYIVTDYAMYRFHAGGDGVPMTDWRTEYDRGTRMKPGMIHRGSGQTPTLLGDLVVIGDNAEPRMNILFLRRSDGGVVCQIPVFEDGLSCSEISPIGLARAGANGTEYSVILENDYGIVREDVFKPGGICTECVGGITRVDLIPDTSGGYIGKEMWTNPEKSGSGMPKLSLASGLLYLYTYQSLPDDDYGWHFTAVDFETGETVFKVPTGTSVQYTNFGPPITLDPDGGTAYTGTMFGLLSIQDTAP